MATHSLAELERSGIYQIRNKINGKLYVGSAKIFRVRWNGHRARLKKGEHHSLHMQSSWKKHGPENFEFEVLEFCSAEDLLKREQHYIDTLVPAFNVCRSAGSTLGRLHGVETKAKIAAKAVGRKFPPRSAEYKAKLSAIHKGRPKSPEHIAAMQAGREKRVYTEEQRKAISEALRNAYQNGTRSRERPPEYRKKIASSLTGRPLSEETKRKIGDAFRGKTVSNRKPTSPEALERIRAANRIAAEKRRGVKKSPESITKMAEALRGRKQPAEQCAKKSEHFKAMWADPVKRAQILEVRALRRAQQPPKEKKAQERKPPAGGWKFPQEVRDKMSAAKKGRPWTEAQRAGQALAREARNQA